jgi:hypothetical protein
VDEVSEIEDASSVFALVRKIRGRFDVAILFPSLLRPDIEIWLAQNCAPGRFLKAVA